MLCEEGKKGLFTTLLSSSSRVQGASAFHAVHVNPTHCCSANKDIHYHALDWTHVALKKVPPRKSKL